METLQRILSSSLAILIAAPVFTCNRAAAADRWWDGGSVDIATNGNSASAGGAGTWNTTLLNWDAGAAPHVAWNNAGNDTAIFGGTAGAINVAVPITVGAVTLATNGYTFSGSPVEIAGGGIFKGPAGGSHNFAGFALAPGNSTYRFQSNSTSTGNFGNGNIFTMSASLTGAGNSVVISGTQPVYLTGTNDYGGGTTVNPGAALGFTTANIAGLGVGSVAVGANASILRTGGSLNNTFLQRLASTTNILTIYANNAGSGNALDLSGTNGGTYLPNASLATWDNVGTQSFAFTGTITPADNTYRFGGPRAGNYINFTTANALTGARDLIVTAGRVRLQNSNNFSGDTLINSTNNGSLFITNSLAIQNSAIDTSGAGRLDVGSLANVTLGGLKGSKNAALVFNNTYSAVTTLTLNPGAGVTNTYSGIIADGAPGMALIKTGAGTQVLNGANSHTGPTTVSAGTLALGQASLDEGAAVTVESGAVLRLDFAGTLTLQNLVINGETKPLGTYNSSNTAPFIAGTGSIEVVTDDIDGDGLPDWWELLYSDTDPPSATGLNPGDDLDLDGLTNLQEYSAGLHPRNPDTDNDGLLDGANITVTSEDPRYVEWVTAGISHFDDGGQRTFRGEITMGTDPLNPDTDGDGLKDGVETNTGVWVSATNTGTDPLHPDTDRDGLSDGVETNTGVFVSATNTGTNPILTDTDGDGASDWYEIVSSFTNPVDSASKPAIPHPLPAEAGPPAAANKPVKVYIMSGQSNMVGFGRVGGTHPATLESITSQSKRFSHLVNEGGGWKPRSDVRYRGVIAAVGDAPLAPGFAANTNSFGPELGFGHVMGWYHGEPVLLIKAAQGGRALGWDFLPPGSVSYAYGANTYAGYGDSPGSWPTGSTPTPGQYYGGYQFDQSFKRFTDWHPYSTFASVTNAASVLDSFASHYAEPGKPFAGRDFEIGGFVWWQGWNDGLSYTGQYASQYKKNMVRFIKEIRSYYETIYPDKGAANAPFVLATAAFGGFTPSVANRTVVANAQLAVDGEAKKPNGDPNYPEFVGNVKTIDARHYWRTSGPKAEESHYHHNAECYILTGDALGRAMVELLEAGSQPGTGYATWAGGFAGLTDPNPALDFDKGGLATALEWVLGGDPTDSSDDAGLMPTIDNATDPDGKLLFVFRRSDDSHADENTSITVQYGSNLTGWTTATHQGNAANQITISEVPDGPGFSKVTVALPASLAGGKLFVRLRVLVTP